MPKSLPVRDRVESGGQHLTAWANSGKPGRAQALRLMAIRQTRLESLAFGSPAARESSTVGRQRSGRNGLIFPYESPASVTYSWLRLGGFGMRVAVSPTLSSFVAARIANYGAEATKSYHGWEAPSVAEFAALPLIRHWYETIGLRADGEIVRWSTIDNPDPYPGVKLVEDRYDWLSALVEGAGSYPELRELLSIRGPAAVECRCAGYPPFISGKFICPECCGLGWVEAIDTSPGVATKKGSTLGPGTRAELT